MEGNHSDIINFVRDGKSFISLEVMIQMELCSGMTLREYINKRGEVNRNENFKLIK